MGISISELKEWVSTRAFHLIRSGESRCKQPNPRQQRSYFQD